MGEFNIASLARALPRSPLLDLAGGASMWPWRGRVRLVRPTYRAIKRAIDLVLCAISLPLVAPLLGLIAVAIYVDSPGPVLFRQSRTGKGGRRFGMLKFRTMVPNAEELKKTYAHLNELEPPDFKITNDPRITRVGDILRRTSLDELPQIVNVLRGEMSLVGPRPTSFAMTTYRLWHTERLEVLPGITGLWQVRGRSDLEFDERVRLDIEYIENRSLLFDLEILVLTVGAVFRQRGAY